MQGKIHSLESCGTVDGPGIRLVVFTQGCPLRCMYCHNPDTWETSGGQLMEVSEIIDAYENAKTFLKNGGITVTGGEPLLQIDFLIDLFTECKKHNIHTCIDTSGIVYRENKSELIKKLDQLMSVTDLVLLDIKHINPTEHQKLTGHGNEHILAFAKYLERKQMPVWIRHVVVPGITLNDDYLFELGYFLGQLTNIKALDVLPYHTLGTVKYENLGIPYPLKDVEGATKDDAIHAREIILSGMKKRLKEIRGIK